MTENMKIATTVLDHLSLAQLLELNDILWAKIVSLNQEADHYETGTQSTPIDEFTEELLSEAEKREYSLLPSFSLFNKRTRKIYDDIDKERERKKRMNE